MVCEFPGSDDWKHEPAGGNVLKQLICRVLQHRVDRRRVWNDSLEFRTNCTRCGTPLLRDHKGWRPFDSARDARVDRTAHPRSGLD